MPKRVLAIASGGGHFIHLMRLSPAREGHQVIIATVDPTSRAPEGDVPFFTFRDASRADWWRIPAATLDTACILMKVMQQVITSTGAVPVLIAATLGRVCSRVVTNWPLLANDSVEHWGSVL